MKRKLYLLAGIISVILGAIGIALPLLPTTPFLLLGLFCFERSSDRFYNYLIKNKYFGKYLEDYKVRKGITLRNKIIALSVLTLGMGKGFLSMGTPIGRTALVIVFIGVSIHILKMDTLKEA